MLRVNSLNSSKYINSNKYMLRALLQILFCKAGQLNHPNIHAPTFFGREICGEKLVPSMMDKPSRPPAATGKQYVLRTNAQRCSCAAAGVNCVVACKRSAKSDNCARVLDSESDDDDVVSINCK